MFQIVYNLGYRFYSFENKFGWNDASSATYREKAESYLVYAWLKHVEKNGQVIDIHWRPFAIHMDIPNEYWTQPWESAKPE